jgi:hypothetical protein
LGEAEGQMAIGGDASVALCGSAKYP